MADATLLPCPFCGGERAERHPDINFVVWCPDCYAHGPTVSYGDKTREEKWNTRQPQLPSDDGLIKALEDLFAGGFIEAGTRLEGQWASELVVRLKPLREALSRHKAPLSVRDQVERDKEAFASLPTEEQQAARAELRSIGQNPGVEFAPLSVAGDDVERLIDELREHGTDLTVEYARAVPKRLLIEAANRLTALQVTEGDKVERLRGLLEEAQCLFAHGVGAMTDNGDKDNQERNIREAGELMLKISKELTTLHSKQEGEG